MAEKILDRPEQLTIFMLLYNGPLWGNFFNPFLYSFSQSFTCSSAIVNIAGQLVGLISVGIVPGGKISRHRGLCIVAFVVVAHHQVFLHIGIFPVYLQRPHQHHDRIVELTERI